MPTRSSLFFLSTPLLQSKSKNQDLQITSEFGTNEVKIDSRSTEDQAINDRRGLVSLQLAT